MENKKKKKIKIRKNLIIGLILIIISMNKMLNYINVHLSNFATGILLILTGIFLLLPFIFPSFFEKFKNKDEEQEQKTKPEVYFYSKPQKRFQENTQLKNKQ
jgi:flagellar basal body-associated protein FliL